MKVSIDKYRFYNSNNMVVAVSTYAGKPVRGVAKCDPCDKFSMDDGKALAVARCNEKVSEKRLKRAKRKVAEAYNDYIVAKTYYERMQKYLDGAQIGFDEAKREVEDIVAKLG